MTGGIVDWRRQCERTALHTLRADVALEAGDIARAKAEIAAARKVFADAVASEQRRES